MNQNEIEARIAWLEREVRYGEGPNGFAPEWQIDLWRAELRRLCRERDTVAAELCVS